MNASKFKRFPGSRAFWFLFGVSIGLGGVWVGVQRGHVGEALIGVGLILLGIQGLLRPVVLTRAGKISKEEMSRDVAIGSPAFHGGLSLLMMAALLVGFVLKYVMNV